MNAQALLGGRAVTDGTSIAQAARDQAGTLFLKIKDGTEVRDSAVVNLRLMSPNAEGIDEG